MASQTAQKLRRNPSPSCLKQGPLKATKIFGLKSSPSASPTPQWTTDPHRKTRRSPDHKSSPDRNSPCSPGFKDKKSHRKSPVPIKRTNSLDAIAAPYLKGEWPREPIVPYQVPTMTTIHLPPTASHTTCDKFTQTDGSEWDDRHERRHKKSHKRSSSLGNEEKLKKEKIKARLAKHHKEGSKSGSGNQSRKSPIQGNHRAVTHISSHTRALSIPNIPKSPYKILGSVEGLNQEIEKLVLTSISAADVESHCRNNVADDATPDGHRAPVLELLHPSTRSVNTQTPSGTSEHLTLGRMVECSDSSADSGSQTSSPPSTDSPVLGSIPDQVQADSPVIPSIATDDAALKVPPAALKGAELEGGDTSPNPNQFLFRREPPDGCEKVVVEENRRSSTEGFPYSAEFCPIKKPTNFHIPSRSSAFCPLLKSYVPHAADLKHSNAVSKDREC